MKTSYSQNERITDRQRAALYAHLENGLQECGGLFYLDIYETHIVRLADDSPDLTELFGLGSSSKTSASAAVEQWLSSKRVERAAAYDFDPVEMDETGLADGGYNPAPGSRGNNNDLRAVGRFVWVAAVLGTIGLAAVFPTEAAALGGLGLCGAVAWVILRATG